MRIIARAIPVLAGWFLFLLLFAALNRSDDHRLLAGFLACFSVLPFSILYSIFHKHAHSGVYIFLSASTFRFLCLVFILLFAGERNIELAVDYLIGIGSFLCFQLVSEVVFENFGPELRKRKGPQNQSYE